MSLRTRLFTYDDRQVFLHFDDDERWVAVRENTRFSNTPKHRIAYDDILEINAGNSGEGGKFGNDFDPLIRHIDQRRVETTLRISGFRSNRKACEELCAWLRRRMAIDARE